MYVPTCVRSDLWPVDRISPGVDSNHKSCVVMMGIDTPRGLALVFKLQSRPSVMTKRLAQQVPCFARRIHSVVWYSVVGTSKCYFTARLASHIAVHQSDSMYSLYKSAQE